MRVKQKFGQPLFAESTDNAAADDLSIGTVFLQHSAGKFSGRGFASRSAVSLGKAENSIL